MPATSCCARSAGPARPRSSARACWCRRRRARRAGAALSRGRRRRHARHRRRRHGVAVEPAAPGDPRDARYRRAEGRRARPRRSHGSIRMWRSSRTPMRLVAGQRARSDRPLRPRRRRLRQFRHALSRVRRLLLREASRWSPRRSAPSTARSRPSARTSAARTARPIRPIAACFPSRRRPARFRPAPRPAFSARSPACSAR